jgi:hypothetical protein
VIETKVLSNQYAVLVDADLLAALGAGDGNVLLPDGLEESHPVEALLEARHDGEAGGGLPDVLPGGRHKDRALPPIPTQGPPESAPVRKLIPPQVSDRIVSGQSKRPSLAVTIAVIIIRRIGGCFR